MRIKNYEDLEVWQKSVSLVTKLYNVTSNFPKSEQFGLTSQIRRSSVSIPSNIAEGSIRRSKAEFARFVNISSGSLAELRTQLLIANNLGYISESDYKNFREITDVIGKMLFRLNEALLKIN